MRWWLTRIEKVGRDEICRQRHTKNLIDLLYIYCMSWCMLCYWCCWTWDKLRRWLHNALEFNTGDQRLYPRSTFCTMRFKFALLRYVVCYIFDRDLMFKRWRRRRPHCWDNNTLWWQCLLLEHFHQPVLYIFPSFPLSCLSVGPIFQQECNLWGRWSKSPVIYFAIHQRWGTVCVQNVGCWWCSRQSWQM